MAQSSCCHLKTPPENKKNSFGPGGKLCNEVWRQLWPLPLMCSNSCRPDVAKGGEELLQLELSYLRTSLLLAV